MREVRHSTVSVVWMLAVIVSVTYVTMYSVYLVV